MDAMMGDWEQADVLIVGDVIVGVGPGLLTAADDDNAIVIDCKGTVVLPSKPDFSAPATTSSLTPGNHADIAVLRDHHLDMLIRQGKVEVWDGAGLESHHEEVKADPFSALPKDHANVGMWIDENNFLRQELLPDGRYDEAREDRPSAYQGQYWIIGSKILYLDDLGFWAFGEFKDNILYHAGYRLTRHTSGDHQ
jgi:adenine deaminase